MNVNVPRVGSVASCPCKTEYVSASHTLSGYAPQVLTHFILLPGVIWPNSLEFERTVTYALSESSGLSVALPKYSLPAAFARVSKPAVELGLAAPVVVVDADVVVACVRTSSVAH